MTATIRRWGNSAAVRIPRYALVQANLEEGAEVEIIITKAGEITLRAVRKRKSIQELFADYDGGFFMTEEIDWGKPQGDEVMSPASELHHCAASVSRSTSAAIALYPLSSDESITWGRTRFSI